MGASVIHLTHLHVSTQEGPVELLRGGFLMQLLLLLILFETVFLFT